MPILKERLGRWCMASISVHFMPIMKAVSGAPLVYVQAQIPRTTQNSPRYYELRMDGPHLTKIAKNEWKVSGDINIVCTVQQTEDTYAIYDLSGPMQAAMVDIPLLRCGPDNPPDDDTQFGCWYVQFSRREDIKGAMMGRIETNIPLVQLLVAGHYETTLKDLT